MSCEQSFSFPVPAPAIRSPRGRRVAQSFGISIASIPEDQAPVTFDNQTLRRIDALLPSCGRIVLITGGSGSGKSSLLRALQQSMRHVEETESRPIQPIDLMKLRPPNRPMVDCFGRKSLVHVLEMLSRVGLAEVWTYLRTPVELSDGQRWRLRLALALMKAGADKAPDSDPNTQPDMQPGVRPNVRPNARARRRGYAQACPSQNILVCDEFAALLDRVTACVVARTLRRAIDQCSSAAAIVATSHEDLAAALRPDLIVRCDFGSVSIEPVNPQTPETVKR